MSSPQLRLVSTDIRVQARNGFYAVYAVLTTVFVAILIVTPIAYRPRVFELIVLLDPSFMGFFFAGGLILLERDQGVLPLIVTRGRGFRSWWAAKVSSIIALAMLVVAVLVGLTAASGMLQFQVPRLALMVLGLLLTVPAFFSLGVATAGRFPRVIDYFVYSAIIMTPAMFPLVELLGVSVGPIGAISPVWGALVLVTSLSGSIAGGAEIAAAVASLLVWNVIGYRLASRGFAKLAGVTGAGDGQGVESHTADSLATASPAAARAATASPAGENHAAGHGRHHRRARGRFTRSAAWTDIRLILREPATCGLLFAPLVIAPLLGRGIPYALGPAGPMTAILPQAVSSAVVAHMAYVRSFAILLIASLYGILGGLIFLDEKDTGMVPVLRTLPGPRRWYLYRRCGRLMALYGVMIAAAVPLSGIEIGAGTGAVFLFVLSLGVDGLALPMFFFALAVVAKTKLQGLALSKILNVFIVAPFIIAAVPERWVWLVGVFPTAWGTLLRTATTDPLHGVGIAVVGVAYAGAITVLLLRKID